jgi:hypothetical protein
MNEQLLLRLPHHQFAFTIPKVLRAFFRHDKRLHGEISRLVYGLVQDFTSEAAGKSIRCAALVVFQSAGEFVRWNPTGMDCSSREASIAEGAIFSSATHAWAHRILAPHRDTTKFPNSSRRPSRPTVSATVRLSPRPSVRRGLRSWLWGASVLAIRPNGKL